MESGNNRHIPKDAASLARAAVKAKASVTSRAHASAAATAGQAGQAPAIATATAGQAGQAPQSWIVAVNMGYGHQRTAYPLRHLSPEGKIIFANDYESIPAKDRWIWASSRMFYEFISRFKRTPIIGDFAFELFDQFQKIMSFYPKRDLSRPNLSLKKDFSLIKKGWGKHLIEKLSQDPATAASGRPLPFITTFFTPAFMAEFFGYPGEIYCVICDADISRSWVPLNSSKSRIKYFAPNHRVEDRLKLYGVKGENIFRTGYPLPKENIGSEKMEILKKDVLNRLCNLDPRGVYRQRYSSLIEEYLGKCLPKSNHLFTIMFSVGGAGAQKELAIQALRSLSVKIKSGGMRFILMAGLKKEIKDYFEENIRALGLAGHLGRNIEVVYSQDINEYFKKFNEYLRTTDILWTKPSELSFYVGLGIPIIMAPTIGSQEDFNRDWLLRHGAGIIQENANYAKEWLFDFLDSGLFANAAMKGFVETEAQGAFNIEKIIGR